LNREAARQATDPCLRRDEDGRGYLKGGDKICKQILSPPYFFLQIAVIPAEAGIQPQTD
jgi:hypothetical protein